MKALTHHSFFRYLVATALSFALNVGLAALLVEGFAIEPEFAVGAAFATVFVVNFFLMRHFIYGAAHGAGHKQMGLYLVSAVGFRMAEYLAFLIAHTAFHAPYTLAQIGVLIASALLKYVYYGMVVFKKSR